jgi:group I intron endonuclease
MPEKCGVYLIISPTGGRYIGSSRNISKRWNRYKNLSCRNQPALLSSLKKYGPENHIFSIVFICEKKDLLFWERVFGDIYLALADFEQGLNIRLPAYNDKPVALSSTFRKIVSENGKKRFSDPEERKKNGEKTKAALNKPGVREMLSQLHRDRFANNPELGIERSLVRKRFYEGNPVARQLASEKTRQFFSENPQAQEAAIKVLKKYYQDNPTVRKDRMVERFKNNPQLGPEHSKKLIQYYIGHPEARETASKKAREQLSDRWTNVRSKRVVNVETNEVYPCSMAVSEMLNVPNNTLRNWLTGKSTNNTPYRYLNTVQNG